MLYARTILDKLHKKMGKGKAIVIVGARQVGKTTLMQQLLGDIPHLFINGDDPLDRQLMDNPNTAQLRSIIGKHKVVLIDEAQRIQDIGLTLKIIIDQFKEVQLLVSGSSAFDLANKTQEPLTGRKWEYTLFPLSWEELEESLGYLEATKQLELRMLYGFYPDVLNNPGMEQDILGQLIDGYLYKDLLAFSGIRKPEELENLVKALALQIGNEVSYNELSQLLGIDKNTVGNYIRILEQGFVIYRLGTYSRNLRNEIKRNQKIYFYDNGIRNAVLGNFIPLDSRADKGALWENFLLSERIKHNAYHGKRVRSYFWRTKQQQEVDYVEEINGKVEGFEFKWQASAREKLPKSFMDTYQAKIKVFDRHNFRDFVLQ